MRLSDKKPIQQIVVAMAALGLREVVISPGSRNAPLILSFNRHPAFRCTSIRDERSAAFFALGKAIELKEPVALLCTSGSASLNFAPAIAEAFYQRIPLIVITADRPLEWIDQSDGQTIRQSKIYQNYIRRSYDLAGDAASSNELWYNERCISEGFNISRFSDKGPVHFNIPMDEPLYNTAPPELPAPKIFREAETEMRLSDTALQKLTEESLQCRKIMILVGQHPKDEILQSALQEASKFSQVAILTESTSNVHDAAFIEHIDRCITGFTAGDAESFMPDLLITIGGAVVSKRIKALLRKYRPRYHWNVDPFDCCTDTYQSLTTAIRLPATQFLAQWLPVIPHVKSEYKEKWLTKSRAIAALHESFIGGCAFSDLKVFHQIYENLPVDTHLHLANSSPVRYAQLFDNHRVASCWSNRGTSGIDGSTSTVVGAATAAPEKNFLLVTGDVAFYYDINGLWNEEPADRLKIIVINNRGGGIFRIISGPDKVEEMETFLETSMHTNAGAIAKHYNWKYLAAHDQPSLKQALENFFSAASGRTILEVFTDAETNPEVLDAYWKYLKENSSQDE